MKKYIILLLLIPLLAHCSDDKSVEVIVPPKEKAKDLRDGITILSDDSLAFVLYAPGKNEVHLIGSFSGWEPTADNQMYKDGNYFWKRVGKLEKGKEYICQYLIDNEIRIADPYASQISDPYHDNYISSTIYPNLIRYPAGLTTEIAMVVSTTKPTYSWTVEDFKISNPQNMTIYELLLRDFTTEKSIDAARQKIPYLKNLGVDAIELMPFNEFEGNDSWGYNPSFYFATDKAYGTDQAYKAFIDECHKNGIAVIMDMVLNHAFGQCPLVRMYMSGTEVTAKNPWFNVKSPNTDYSWGYDFNHDSQQTQNFVDSVCSFWMSEYKVDGFRFDFTKGFTNTAGNGWNYDAKRIALLKRMTNEIRKRNSDAIVIFEHLTDNKEEKELAEHGIFLWGNMNFNFNESTMGWGEEAGDHGNKGDLTWASYQEREWNKPQLISYMESHDEERLMFKNLSYGKVVGDYNVKNLETGLKRNEAATIIYMTIPGPKMIWQFGEIGYDVELNGKDGQDRLKPKPPYWDKMDEPGRKSLSNVYKEMLKLRKEDNTFLTTIYEINLTSDYKQVLLKSANGDICAIANLDTESRTEEVKFGSTGQWIEHFSQGKLSVTAPNQNIELKPGEYRLYKKVK